MSNTSGQLALLCLFLFPLLPIQTVWGQEEESSWQVKGFVDTYHAVRSASPNDLMSSRTRIRGEIGKSLGAASLFVSFNATYNALLKERTGLELREAYIDYRERHWGFRLGRQLVIWGAADGVRITDLVSPMDMTEFLAQDYDDIRMPVNALRFFVNSDKLRLELVAVPTFEGYRLPTDAVNPWTILPKESPLPIVWDDSRSHLPQLRFSNIEYGGRLSVTLPGVDFSIAALHTWNKIPVITYAPTASHITLSPHYYRMTFLGGDISKPLGQVVLRGELAYNIAKHFSYTPSAMGAEQKGFDTINYLVGLDWYAPNDWVVMAQFSMESILMYESQIAQPRNNSLLTLNLSKKLCNNNLQLSNFTYLDLTGKGWFSRFATSYALNDAIQLTLGYDWFGGNEGIFGSYKKNSQLWLKAKYSF